MRKTLQRQHYSKKHNPDTLIHQQVVFSALLRAISVGPRDTREKRIYVHRAHEEPVPTGTEKNQYTYKYDKQTPV